MDNLKTIIYFLKNDKVNLKLSEKGENENMFSESTNRYKSIAFIRKCYFNPRL